MKKSKQKKTSARKKSSKRASLSVVIDKKLDVLSKKILFKKKLEKANRLLSKAGVPA